MKKYLFIILIMFVSSLLSAQQEREQYIHKHLVRADASIIAGYMFKQNFNNVYVNGNAEYYIDNRISIRGDANYMLGSTGLSVDSIGLKDNHSVMLGPVFHIHTNGHFDPYFILQPGIAYTSSYDKHFNSIYSDNTFGQHYKGVMSPLATAGFGFNYYFQRFAHLFMETRYVYGQHLSEAPHPLSLEELRVTFGLGFNLFIIKEKKKPG